VVCASQLVVHKSERATPPWRGENRFGVVSLLAMMRIYASTFVESMTKLHKWEVEWSRVPPETVLPSPISLTANVSTLAVIDLIGCEMTSALAKCARIEEYCNSPERFLKPLTYGEASRLLKELRESLEDDFKSHVFLHVTTADSVWYEKPTHKWERVLSRFYVRSDIEECSKCFALSRYPAAVFHSLQIVELGLVELGKFLETPTAKSGWTQVCNELRRITKGDHKALTPAEQKHFAFLEQIHATTEALKNAWRNKIDHAANRLIFLPGDLNQEIAHDIIIATRHFMVRLAEELPEGTINS
jgi:hypothetical protein